MDLVFILVVLAVQFNFRFVVKHVESKANSLADEMSHDNLPQFISQVPQEEYNKPPQILPPLLNFLGYDHYIWTSTD